MRKGFNTHSVEGGSTGDNLDQLHGNSSLSCFVVLKVKLVENFLGILRCVLHCIHSSGLLRGGIVKETNPQVWGEIKLVKGWVRGVLIWKSLVVELSELHRFDESLSWHKVHVSWDVGDGGLELVMNNSDLIGILGHLSDMDGHSHNSGVVVWSSDLGNGNLQKIWEWSHHSNGSFISNGENLHLWPSVWLFNKVLNLSNNSRVNSTTETFIGGNWDNNGSTLSWFSWHLSLHELITFENHIDGLMSEVFTSSKSSEITLHLRSGHHLHCLGNLTNGSYGSHSNFKSLLWDSEASLLCLEDWCFLKEGPLHF